MGRSFLVSLLFAGLVFAGSDTPAIPNFHQVADRIYRGGQPSSKDFQSLAKMGITTVLDLRNGVRHEEKLVTAAGMRYVSVPMNGFETPSEEQIKKALAVLQDAGNGAVFVHCRRGADRTGTVIACYRISHDRWSNQKALDEARSLGMSILERGMRGYVLRYRAPAIPVAPSTAIAAEAAAK